MNIKNNESNASITLSLLSKTFAIFSITLGLIVLLGWYFNQAVITQLHSSLAPMHYNTALCLSLLGVGILSVNYKWSFILPSLVFFISFITLMQFILDFNLGVDQFFLAQKGNLYNLLPGRMSPITAICLLFSSIIILLFSSSAFPIEIKLTLSQTCTFFILSLPVISLLGYVFNLNFTFAWSYFSPMAIHTALGIICIGISLKFSFINHYKDSKPLFEIFIVSGVLLAIWLVGVYQENTKIKAELNKEMHLVGTQIKQQLDTQLQHIKSIKTNSNNIPTNTNKLILNTPWITRIQWFNINSASNVFSLPKANTQNFLSSELLELFEHVEKTKALSSSVITETKSNNKSILVIIPNLLNGDSSKDDPLKGFTVVYINIDLFFKQLVLNNTSHFLSIKLNHNYQEFYNNTQLKNENYFSLKQNIQLAGSTWSIIITPNLSFFKNITTFLPAWLFTSAFFATLLSAFISQYWYLLQQKSHELSKLKERFSDDKKTNNAIAENINDAIVIIDNKSIIQSFSNKAESLFGYTKEEIVGRSVNLLMPTKLSLAHDKHVQGFNANKKTSIITKRKSLKGLTKSQQEFPIEITLVEVLSAKKQLFIGIIKDISQQQHNEVQLDKAKCETESIKLAKSKFIEYMGHEIKSPMNSIYGVLQLLQHESDSHINKDLIEKAIFSSKSLLCSINDIIDFSKIEDDKLFIEESVISLKQLLHRLMLDMTPIAEQKNVLLSLTYSSNFTDGWLADPVRIRQIVLNLIINSLKFTQDGKIDIHIDIINSKTNRKSLKISVSDTGIGMHKDKVSSLFNHIDQGTKLTTYLCDGSDLDLLIVEKMIQLMDGSISVGSIEGEGSCFLVILPLIKEDKNFSEIQLHTEEVAPHFNDKVILLVESDKISKVIIKAMLEATNADVDVVSSGEEALSYLNKKQVDIILMNTRLPNLNGIETCRQIREINKILPIIAISENKIKDDISNFQHLGFNARINKPIELHYLYQILTEQLRPTSKLLL